MNKLLQKANCAIKWLTNSNGMKNYTIKFKKLRFNLQPDIFSGYSWNEVSSNALYNFLSEYFSEEEDVIIKKILIRDTYKFSYIKFEATPSGYLKVFSIFTSKELDELVQIISPYKP